MKVTALILLFAMLAAPAAEVQVLDVSWRITESRQGSSRVAWKALVRNNTWKPVAFTLVVELKDWDGFVLADSRRSGLALTDGETKEFAGTVRISNGSLSDLDEAAARVEMR